MIVSGVCGSRQACRIIKISLASHRLEKWYGRGEVGFHWPLFTASNAVSTCLRLPQRGKESLNGRWYRLLRTKARQRQRRFAALAAWRFGPKDTRRTTISLPVVPVHRVTDAPPLVEPLRELTGAAHAVKIWA